MYHRQKSWWATAAGVTAALCLAGCGDTDDEAGTTSQSSDAYPLEYVSCGVTQTLEDKPERVVMINSDPAPLLDAVGELDSVVGRTGIIPQGFPQDQQDALRELPEIESDTGETGGTVISLEAIIELDPDLVFGPPSNIDVEALQDRGIPTFTPDEFCDTGAAPAADFNRIQELLASYGEIFDAKAQAADVAAEVTDALEAIDEVGDDRTAAALYVMDDGAAPYVYGGSSMMTPIMEKVGLDPLYADVEERVSEVSVEHLAAEEPDVIIIGNQDEEQDDPVGDFKQSTVFEKITQARAGDEPEVVHLDYMLADPPSPNVAVGAEQLADDLR